jgi:hypothetical protein
MVSFDPTWAAGYIDQGQFRKRIRDPYYSSATRGNDKITYADDGRHLSYPINNTEFTSENRSFKI